MRRLAMRVALLATIACGAAACGEDDIELCKDCGTPTPTPSPTVTSTAPTPTLTSTPSLSPSPVSTP